MKIRFFNKKGFGDFHNSGAAKVLNTLFSEKNAAIYCDDCVINFEPSRSQTLPNNEWNEWSVLPVLKGACKTGIG